uniref:KIAA1522 n=1 Tax=Caenorhabditis tropicalis TaxID=1561998 RepID=A0A1I7TGG3_9PELO
MWTPCDPCGPYAVRSRGNARMRRNKDRVETRDVSRDVSPATYLELFQMDRKGSDSSFLAKVQKSSWSRPNQAKSDVKPNKRLNKNSKEQNRTKWTTGSLQEGH